MPEGILDFFELVWAESQSLDSRESKKDIIWLTSEGKCVVLNYFIACSTNASAESLNSKMKAFRAQLRGVSDLPFFMYRLSTIFG